MDRRLFTLAAVGTLSAALLAGCGSSSSGSGSGGGGGTINSSQTPAEQIQSGFTNLTSGDTLTTTVKLGVTGAQILQLQSLGSGGGSQLTSAEADDIAGGSIVITEHSTSGSLASAVGNSSSLQYDVAIDDNGKSLGEIRVLNGTVYIQAPVQSDLSLFGAPSSVFGNLQAEVSSAPAFIGDLLGGKWIAIQSSTISGLEGEFEGALGGGAAPSPASSAQAQVLLNELKALLTTDVTVTQTGSDTYNLSGNTRTLATDFVKDIAQLEPAAASELDGKFNPSTVPSKTVTVGAQTTDGHLSQLSLDVLQFAPPKDLAKLPSGTTFPVDLDFGTTSTSVAVPSGAVMVTSADLGQLLGGLASLGGGVTSSGSGTATPSSF